MADDIVSRLRELRNLPPEERLKRLREIEEQNRKEIEEAHKLMQESEAEIIEDEKEKEQLPIPQLKVTDIDMLVSDEERRIFATKRQVDVRRKKTDEDEEKPALRIDKGLEEALGEQSIRLTPAQIEESKQYQVRLAAIPTRDVYSMVGNLMQEVKQQLDERGYLSEQQRKEFEVRATGFMYAAKEREQMYKGNERTAELIDRTANLTKNIMQYIRG